jgi:hypothetical protein
MIYWLFAGIALLVLASSGANTRSGGADIGQVLVGVVYAIGRDMRRVLREWYPPVGWPLRAVSAASVPAMMAA